MRRLGIIMLVALFVVSLVPTIVAADLVEARSSENTPVEEQVAWTIDRAKRDIDEQIEYANDDIKTYLSSEKSDYFENALARIERAKSEFKDTINGLENSSFPRKAYEGKLAELSAYLENAEKDVIAKASPLLEKSLAGKYPAKTVYSGSDLAQLKEMVMKEWKATWPKDQILHLSFPKTQWQRTTERKWNSASRSWYTIDVSALEAEIVVKLTDTIAVVHPVYINKNHAKGTMSVGAETKGSSYDREFLLISNVK